MLNVQAQTLILARTFIYWVNKLNWVYRTYNLRIECLCWYYSIISFTRKWSSKRQTRYEVSVCEVIGWRLNDFQCSFKFGKFQFQDARYRFWRKGNFEYRIYSEITKFRHSSPLKTVLLPKTLTSLFSS